MNTQWFEKLKKKITQPDAIQDVLLSAQRDRRLLPNIPNRKNSRAPVDRRGQNHYNKKKISKSLPTHEDIRYDAVYRVRVICQFKKGRSKRFFCDSVNISTSGSLLHIQEEEQKVWIEAANKVRLAFEIRPGTMPEGYEMKLRIQAFLTRTLVLEGGTYHMGFVFQPHLVRYVYKNKSRNMRSLALLSLVLLVLSVLMLRTDSFLYLRFNRLIYFYSIATAVFLLSRYLFGMMYRPVPIDDDFTPGVTVVIPCFNEEEWIQTTILSCLDQDYPTDCLEVIVVDDCSTDQSAKKITEIMKKLQENESRYDLEGRIHFIQMEKNAGKRDALSRGIHMAKHDLVVFVDSDSFLDSLAIRNIVQPFKDPKMGGVTGRTDVANTYTNALTKMQSVRYYIAFRVMKAAESYFDAVTCLSGPLSCYKKELVLENMEAWLDQKFLGQKATFGDDRAMTNFILKNHRTCYQDTAICATIVPNRHKVFLKQQMRWKRSWLRETAIAGSFMWKKEPMMALFFYMGFIIPAVAPVVVLYNLLYVPIVYGVFPFVFLMGLLIMALFMSMAQLFFRRSSTWLYGLWFCVYYQLILLWQMPIAWVTFWKSTWGTRLTPADVKTQEKKRLKKSKKQQNKNNNSAGMADV
ncbi:MAG: glycosyltransferase family 2 protein [Christensenellales bacterium]